MTGDQSSSPSSSAGGPALPSLHFASPIAGFSGLTDYALVQLADDVPFSVLRSLEREGVEFVVVPAFVFFPDYAPELDDAAASALALSSAEDALVLVIVTVSPERVEDSTANLLGPIVVNRHTREAAQVILTGSDYGTRTPLVTAA